MSPADPWNAPVSTGDDPQYTVRDPRGRVHYRSDLPEAAVEWVMIRRAKAILGGIQPLPWTVAVSDNVNGTPRIRIVEEYRAT